MKRKKAAALKYDKTSLAPKITAIGFGQIAEKIIEKANESNVPIINDEKLTNTLCSLSINDYIPSELYETVAEIIAYIYSINDTKRE
ncbi:flagellar biosynthesis protein [Caloramator quimbayensis]|uniref:Flagellar biosynthesis protein n=1 Tax=Caloramator quimbayensis TaxID=1147123 RepID=A0A1T4X702_9CLOT|nr:EscU/YscU/HrcU family type III secretion system export apparatus switch protein [Caloramator quimbayensis]SKA85209.1 flagellar biosynthesis protein [Caloramator quimbayensis]